MFLILLSKNSGSLLMFQITKKMQLLVSKNIVLPWGLWSGIWWTSESFNTWYTFMTTFVITLRKHVKMPHKLCCRQLYWCLWKHLWLCCVPLFAQLEHMLQNVTQITSMQRMKYCFCIDIRSMLLCFSK